MACVTSQAACFSGRTSSGPLTRTSSKNGRQGYSRRREHCASRTVSSSLEEEFKKQLLGLSNAGSNSGQERLKDSSAQQAPSRLDHSSSSASPPETNFDDSLSTPFAANLPLSSEPYHPLEFYPAAQLDLDWGSSTADGDQAWAAGTFAQERSRCFVILFGVGRTETEGIYSLRAVAKDDGLPVDTIVAFENEDDALRYSTLLEATLDHEPTVWPIEWGELLEFCNSAGYRCRLEPAGSLLIPPDNNVGMTDWEKSLKLRKGEFSVLGAEPTPFAAGLPGGLFVDGPDWVFESAPLMHEEDVQAEQVNAVIDSKLNSPAALEAMRANLERLLPQD